MWWQHNSWKEMIIIDTWKKVRKIGWVEHWKKAGPKTVKKKIWQCCQKRTFGVLQETYTYWSWGEWWSRIVLGSCYTDRYDSGTQHARYYPSWEGNMEMDNCWYCCSKWLQCSKNRRLESWEVSGSIITLMLICLYRISNVLFEISKFFYFKRSSYNKTFSKI